MSNPRMLSVLAIEDEEKESPSNCLPVKYLGRVGRWAWFVRGLAEGVIRVLPEMETEEEAEQKTLFEWPDILAVDFRFPADPTAPEFYRMTEDAVLRAEEDPAAPGWSHKLLQPNTGVLMGATLEGWFRGRDLPLLVALHTGSPDDVGSDVSTTLLVAQLLAGSGALTLNGELHPYSAARNALASLPKACEPAILGRMAEYRNNLWRRLGALDFDETRLFVDPDQLVHLLCGMDGAKTDEELDQQLAKVGLAFWDRDASLHVLDLRSLYMDLLSDAGPKGRRWGFLPIQHVKSELVDGEPRVGAILADMMRLQSAVVETYHKAADHVIRNSDPAQSAVEHERIGRKGTKLLALVFACAEEWTRFGIEVSRALDEKWPDPKLDDHDAPTLRRVLEALLAVLRRVDDFVSKPAADRLYAVSDSPEPGILSVVSKYVAWNSAEAHARVLHSALYAPTKDTDRRAALVSRLMDYLKWLGLVETTVRIANKRSKTYYRLLGSRVPGARFAISAEIERRTIAKLLGYRLRCRTPKCDQHLDPTVDTCPSCRRENPTALTTELIRIPTAVGYPGAEFIDSLLDGRVPPHLGRAARWYLSRRQDQLPEEFWPAWCRQ